MSASPSGRYFACSTHAIAVNVISKRLLQEEGGVDLSCMYYVNDGVYGSFNCVLYDHTVPRPSALKVSVMMPSGLTLSGCGVFLGSHQHEAGMCLVEVEGCTCGLLYGSGVSVPGSPQVSCYCCMCDAQSMSWTCDCLQPLCVCETMNLWCSEFLCNEFCVLSTCCLLMWEFGNSLLVVYCAASCSAMVCMCLPCTSLVWGLGVSILGHVFGAFLLFLSPSD